MSQYDVAIIGGGAAGLSGALVLSRAGRRVLVIDAGQPRNAPATHMHGFLSRDGMAPAALLEAGRREVRGYGGEFLNETVSTVTPYGDTGFRILLHGEQRISARRLLMATGLRDELPDIAGLRERWSVDVLHCPYCPYYFTAPGVLTATERAELAARGIDIVEGSVEQLIVEDDRLRGVQLDDGCVMPCAALFVPPRFVPNDALLIGLGCAADGDGWVTTDRTGRTSVPGVWAAGNVVDPRAQVITAAGAGSAAAIDINADLVDEDVRHAILKRNSTAKQV